MIGMLTTPTSARIAAARAARLGSSIEACSAKKPKYRKIRISSDVMRASQAHQVPHIGLPQIEPVTSARNVNQAPIGAHERAKISESLAFQISPAAPAPALKT